MRAYPGFRRKSQLDWDAIGEKLLKLTGLTLDEIFPLELATSQMLERPLKWALIRDVEPEQLTAAHERLALPAAQEAILEREDLKEQIARTLGMLTPRQERVMRYRFGLDGQDAHTLAETARHLKLSPERIRQIEANALRRLRHKAYRKYLEPYVT
jgi:RNA polymerase primary sigma factor